jgi:hypothetical protein
MIKTVKNGCLSCPSLMPGSLEQGTVIMAAPLLTTQLFWTLHNHFEDSDSPSEDQYNHN